MGCDYQLVSEILQHRPTKVNYENLENYKNMKLSIKILSQIYHAIQAAINRVNAKAISSAQRIQKFTILPTDFSTATGELSI